MAADERFLARWSRLKAQSARETDAPTAAPPPAPAAAAAVHAPLPPVDSLDFSCDFSAFLDARVEESVKRAALTKLFRSAHFNEMDGLDVYIDDYGRFDPIPSEMLERLNQAKGLLFDEKEPADAAGTRGSTAGAGPEPAVTQPAARSTVDDGGPKQL